METLLYVLYGWLLESHRWEHLVGCMGLSFMGTAAMGVGAAGGMEFKDVQYANADTWRVWEWDWGPWDWLDFLAGVIGSAIGQAMQLVVLGWVGII